MRQVRVRGLPCAILGLLLASNEAFGQARPITVFGLEMDGKRPVIRNSCEEDYRKRLAACWLDGPKTLKGGEKNGTLSIPEKQLPEWVGFSPFDATLDRSGALVRLKASQLRAARATVQSSIESRFGRPSQITDTIAAQYREWEMEDAFISLLCTSTCTVDIVSASARAARLAELRAAKAESYSKPKSP
jgi:hypothetical protein